MSTTVRKRIRNSIGDIYDRYQRYPHEVRVGGRLRIPTECSDTRMYLSNWLSKNGFGGAYSRFWIVPKGVLPNVMGWRFRFKHEEDAVMFKLKLSELLG